MPKRKPTKRYAARPRFKLTSRDNKLCRSVLALDRYEDLVPMTPRAGLLLLAYAVLSAIGAALPAR
jgi:hypothetical protein